MKHQKASEELVETPEALAECVSYLEGLPVLGMDTEFVGEATYQPELCLVQVAGPERLFLIDPYAAGPLDAFWDLLHDPARVVVVHAGREEIRLCRNASGAPPANLFDLQLAAGLTGYPYPMGHAALVGQVLGTRLSKGETLTEWRRRPLTPDQIRYAYDDVRFLLRLYAKISARLERGGRTAWLREECERLVRAATPDLPAAEERWRKLKGIGSLDRKKLAVARALFAWRERRASQLNRPARTIVRDDLLVDLAKRNPVNGEELKVMRGLPHRDLDEIVEVIREGRAVPPEEWPEKEERDQGPPQLGLISSVLLAVLGDLCARGKLAPNLVASNNEVRALAKHRIAGEPGLPAGLLTQGWRARAVLPALLAVLDGRRGVWVANAGAEAPFAYEERTGNEA